MAKENPYNAIVLDVMLPGINGFEVCRQLRDAGVWAPVIMLTARDEVGDRVRGLDAGADDYLVKPFSLLELAARLRALMRRDDRSRPTVLREGDLELDPAARRSWRAGAEARPVAEGVRSSSSCFSGTRARSSRAPRSSTRSWDFAYDGTSNVVDQYVKYLRQKVDRPFGRNDIETVRGVGYRLRQADGA